MVRLPLAGPKPWMWETPPYFLLAFLPFRAACAKALAATSFSFLEVWVLSSLLASLATLLLVVIVGSVGLYLAAGASHRVGLANGLLIGPSPRGSAYNMD